MTAQFLTSSLYTHPLVAECLFSDLVRSEGRNQQSNTWCPYQHRNSYNFSDHAIHVMGGQRYVVGTQTNNPNSDSKT